MSDNETTAKAGPIIVVIEDDEGIRNLIRLALTRFIPNVVIHSFDNMKDATNYLLMHGETVNLILSDSKFDTHRDRIRTDINPEAAARAETLRFFHTHTDETDPREPSYTPGVSITTGEELARKIHEGKLIPGVSSAQHNRPYFILSSGYSSAHGDGVDAALDKPFVITKLVDMVQKALGMPASTVEAVSAKSDSPGFAGKFGQKPSTSQLGA